MEAADDRNRLLMRFIRVTAIQESGRGYFLDPEPYLRELPVLKEQLPRGARVWATDPDHYDFTSVRCIKDLRVESISVRELGNARLGVEISLAPSKFKHPVGLTIRYDGVTILALDVDPAQGGGRVWPDTRRMGDVQLDELLPHEQGCAHEIKMTGGSILVVCCDLNAQWGLTETE